MNKISSTITKWLLLLLAVAGSSFYMTSCSDDDAGGTPMITQVRITDPEHADSTFTRAFPGALIVVQGQNFSGLKTVELNGFSVPWNPNYLLNTSLIVQIPWDLPFKGEYPVLPNTIKLITASGQATYDFTFLAPEPRIGIFKFQPPAAAGAPIEIIGGNFYVVQKIEFTDGTNTIEITDYEVSEDFDVISFSIPAGMDVDGEITVTTESGEVTETYKSNPFPEFLKLSDDLQIPGAPITITGKYFTFINKVVFPGGIEVPLEELEFDALFTQIEVTVPEDLDLTDNAGKVQIVTEFGDVIESPIVFNDWSGVFMTWEGSDGWDWDKGADETANGKKPPFVGTGKYNHFVGNIDANINYWWDALTLVVSFNSFPDAIGVTDATPISQLGFAFNYYTPNVWTNGNWTMQWGWNSGNKYEWKPWATGTVTKDRWVTYTIPLSSMISNTGQTTWGQVKSSFNPADNFLFIQFQNPNNPNVVEVNGFWDNLRVVKLP
jgi:hypothetical protein